MASDDTLPAEPLPPTDEPPERWDRYDLGSKLGEGGMGVVYRATDRRLNRDVAIKFIRGGNPVLTMRLLREARAQARIDHPGVCRVYEVGEVAGRAYIALQLVAGEPLSKATSQMTLDEKVAVMRDVAVAIHEAHRLGIVHRDLKPANIMVERGDDGRWIPIVMDFGLAREATLEVGLTETGALLGTPAYMSPEQARGETRSIDRRSDVYSLGATLYELLTSQPPFALESIAAALDHVINHDPVTPRSIVASLPVDLETIAMKCLRKDPALRYASAKALADDLTRYLDGEPIEGRRLSWRQRLSTSIRKHRALYSIGAASSIAVLFASVLGIRSYLVSRTERERTLQRTQLAQRLGQEAKDIELLLHTSYQLPLHDTRPERAMVRMRMALITVTPHDLGQLGDALIHDALGRGYLALHQSSLAASELEHAERDGLDTPELHAARGRALGEQYHHALEEVRRSGPDKIWVETRVKELEAKFLAPAIEELELARDATSRGALLEATLALYRRDFQSARKVALGVSRATPWLYESKRLAADAAFANTVALADHGGYDAARIACDEANRLYVEAIDSARSDASTYEAAAEAQLERADLDNRQSHSPDAALDSATRLIDRAIAAEPDRATAYTTKAHILTLKWRTKTNGTDDLRPLLAAIADSAQRATVLDPSDVIAWDALGNAHSYRATYEIYHGGVGRDWWRRALEELEHAHSLRPNDPWVNNDLGIVHRWLAQTCSAAEDAMREFVASSAAFERATASDAGYLFAWTNQVEVLVQLAEYQVDRGDDPHDTVQKAIASGDRGLAIDPNYDMLLKWMADAQLREAEYRIRVSVDPVVNLERANGYLDRADRARPRNMTIWWLRARAGRFQTAWLLARHEDAGSAIAAARRADMKVLELAPNAVAGWVERAELELTIGELEAASRDVTKAISLDETDQSTQLVGSDVELAIARSSHDPQAIAHGMKLVDLALEVEPTSVRAKAIKDGLVGLRSP